MESEIHVDPDRLLELARMLDTFSREAADELGTLETALGRLGGTWQDDEYARFRAAMKPVTRMLASFRDEIRKAKPKLEADAEAIREYQRLHPDR